MSTCHCFEGSSANGRYTPKGSYSEIAGLGVYHSKTGNRGGSKFGNILFLPDGFGLSAHNVRLADMYAEKGFATTIVDYFEGDALPDIFMQYTPGTDVESYSSFTPEERDAIRNVNMLAWQKRHEPQHLSELLDRFFPKYQEYLNLQQPKSETGVNRIHIVGHCFGGKHAFRLAKLGDESGVASALIFHPAFLESSDTRDLRVPVLVGCAETDIFTPNLINDMLSQLPASGAQYKFLVYGGTKHGFASRPDPEDSAGMVVFKQAFDDGLAWIKSM